MDREVHHICDVIYSNDGHKINIDVSVIEKKALNLDNGGLALAQGLRESGLSLTPYQL